ncbi:MAG: hypothetical protein MUF54_05565 [Polyangiaceae bacterium]|jgi:hypothetical protein|nr:hypothetical protein [Polyangiaceae bacterium]
MDGPPIPDRLIAHADREARIQRLCPALSARWLPKCAHALSQTIAIITSHDVVERILSRLGLPTGPEAIGPGGLLAWDVGEAFDEERIAEAEEPTNGEVEAARERSVEGVPSGLRRDDRRFDFRTELALLKGGLLPAGAARPECRARG